ncbi:unnamed protein product, partial [Ectocarpus fasciculatus]
MKDATRANVSIPDLHTLHHRIRAIKTELPRLAKDATEIEGERKETEIALNTALIENYNVMVGLYARLGVAPDPEWVATAAGVESFLPAPRDSGALSESFVSDGDEGEGIRSAVEEDAAQASTVPLHSGNPDLSASRVEERVVEQSPSVIFEEDFLAIHANTRGRSKLQDVRKV